MFRLFEVGQISENPEIPGFFVIESRGFGPKVVPELVVGSNVPPEHKHKFHRPKPAAGAKIRTLSLSVGILERRRRKF